MTDIVEVERMHGLLDFVEMIRMLALSVRNCGCRVNALVDLLDIVEWAGNTSMFYEYFFHYFMDLDL